MHAAVKNMNLNEVILSQLDDEKLEKIPILKKLRALEEQAGKDVTVGATSPGLEADQPKLQPKRRPRQNMQQDAEGERRRERRAEPEQKARHQTPRVWKESEGRREREGEAANVTKEKSTKILKQEGDVLTESRSPPSVTTVYLGGIPAGLRVSELKTALRERKAAPLRLTWQGAQHRAFLDYSDPQAADQALEALQGLSLNGHNLQAEMAKSQRGGRRSGQPSKRQRPPIVSKSKIPPETKSGTKKME